MNDLNFDLPNFSKRGPFLWNRSFGCQQRFKKDILFILFILIILFSSFAHFIRSVRIFDDAVRCMSKQDAIELDNEILVEL